MKKILLAGHYYKEKLLFEYSDSDYTFHSSKRVHLHSLPGGLLLLKKLLQSVLPNDEIISLPISDDKIAERISEVKNFGSHDKISIHISRFIGYSMPPGTNAENEDELPIHTDLNIIITDDTGIAPRMLNSLNENAIKKGNFIIFYVPGKSLTKNSLINKISETHFKQVIAVIDADDLREHGMQINSQLSWDKTLEDFREEFHTNHMFTNLRKCKAIIIRFGVEGLLSVIKSQQEEGKKNQFEQQFLFYYIPAMYEGQLQEQIDGNMYGITESFEATLIKKILYPEGDSLADKEIISTSIIPAMKSAFNCLQAGFTKEENSNIIGYPVTEIFKDNSIPVKAVDLTNIMNSEDPISLFNHYTFQSVDLINYLTFRLVKDGISSSFDSFPYAEFNKIKTFDRDEIEGFRGLKHCISNYLSGNEIKPLSVGVFGPPGSGKSFGVKQIAEYFKKKIIIREFNLSQFRNDNDLVNAFREVSDINLSGKIPMVFFDEFDCDFDNKPLGWLAKFLAPMQDGEYKAGEKIHPIGKGIFIFAGGNFATYQQFKALISDEDYKNQFGNNNPYLSSLSAQQIKSLKVDDFDSRFKWHLNIKGIDKKDARDHLYTLRRAMVLKNIFSNYPNIKSPSGKINADDDLLSALMEIPRFKHGARSLETIINSSGIKNKTGFHKAYLSSAEQLKRDIDTSEFAKLMKEQNIFPTELIEPVAQEIHKNWLAKEEQNNSIKATMKVWNDLNQDVQDSNRQQAIDMIRKMQAYGYSVISSEKMTLESDHFSHEEIEQMAKMEHDRWMNEKISKGWVYGKKRNDELKIHDCLLNWNELDEKTKDLDRNAVSIIPELLKTVGFAVVKENVNK